ncbi:non-specific lipid-transfer protein 1-like [Solanum stenotomum]|uniref:non-specific lipid-transfer protein 1-like n=1 Tax=Solanum stenotomum TaxID=172797 RepID=UPI0020D18FA4|nr:non-specific lipid-transfer protein 1-like [Solanum stenotomum]
MLNKQLFPLFLVYIAVAVATATASSKAAKDALVTCNMVYSSLEPCLGYVLGGGLSVPSECCGGIKSLLSTGRTIDDRQSACKCIKSAGSNANDAQVNRAATLPRICKTNVPFKISPHVDCSKVN